VHKVGYFSAFFVGFALLRAFVRANEDKVMKNGGCAAVDGVRFKLCGYSSALN
jgi:hypothetical protein